MKWWNWVLLNPSATRLVRQIDKQLEGAFIRYATLPPERKRVLSSYMVQFIARVMPDYNFGLGFHVQFVAFALYRPKEVIRQGASTFADLRNGAREGGNEETPSRSVLVDP